MGYPQYVSYRLKLISRTVGPSYRKDGRRVPKSKPLSICSKPFELARNLDMSSLELSWVGGDVEMGLVTS